MMEGSFNFSCNYFGQRFEDNDFKQWIPPPVYYPYGKNNGFVQVGLSQKYLPVPAFNDWSKSYWRNFSVTPEKKSDVNFWYQDTIYAKGCPELSRNCFSGLSSPVKQFIPQDNRKLTYSSISRKTCNFCRQNDDRKEFYSGHRLKDKSGKVECPILREHVCEICGATGDDAHTRSYCPWRKKNGKNASHLKKSLHNSSGRIRKGFQAYPSNNEYTLFV